MHGPNLRHKRAADIDLIGRGLIKTGEVTAEHDEICTHGERQGNVIVVYNAAIRADRDVYTGFLVVFIARLGDFNGRSCLTAADALLLTGDADGAAADADLYKVCACFGQEPEPSRSTTLPAPTLTLSP